MILETEAKVQMPIWIINDILPSVWENHSTTHSSAHVPQSVFPNELLKLILSLPLSNLNEWEARDEQDMIKVRR